MTLSETPMPAMNTEMSVDVAVIGGGPAGLMAAEVISRAGHAVHVFDGMPSVGRKFLLAANGAINRQILFHYDFFDESDPRAAQLTFRGQDELRRIAEHDLGDRFDLREFHDVVLGNGAVPLAMLEDIVLRWIESKM